MDYEFQFIFRIFRLPLILWLAGLLWFPRLCKIVEFLVRPTLGYLRFQNVFAAVTSFNNRNIINEINYAIITNGKGLRNLQFPTGQFDVCFIATQVFS